MAVERDQVEDVYSLSPLQEGILYHCERNPESPAYWNQLSFRISGPLDAERLRQAWQAVLDRHPALRSSFARDRSGAPRQVVRRTVTLAFEVVEAPGGEPGAPDGDKLARDDWLNRWLAEDLARRPSLRAAPLFRIALIRLSANEHRMVWTVHHIVQDGWSSARLLQEVFALYGQGADTLPLADVVPYRRYVEHVSGRSDEALRQQFWTDYLADLPAAVDIGEPDGAGSQVVESLERLMDGARLQAAARRCGVTPSTLAQGAWALTLAAETGVSDVLFGVTVADRDPDLEGADEIVGLMLATLPVRIATGDEAGLRAWLGDQQRRFSQQRAHLAPLADIQRWAGQGGGRLFDSLLVFENYPLPENVAEGTGLTVDDFSGFEQTNYPLTLTIAPGAQWRLSLAFTPERIQPARAQRLLDRLHAVLETLADAAVDESVRALSWWLPGEREKTLLSGPPGQAADRDVVALLAEQVGERPDQVAVRFGEEQMTYAELWQRSAEVAQGLAQQGVAPGDRVALCLHRCLDLPALLLGVWRAGAAFVPLDPDFPPDRLRFIVEDADVCLMVTDDRTVGLELGASVAKVAIDALRGEGSPACADADISSAAYLIYTSGSTGRPKGVVVPHRALANLLLGLRAQLGLRTDDHFLAVTTISFDISLLELLLPLLSGSTLEVLPSDATRDGAAIARRLASATVMQATPATWRLLLETGWAPAETDRKVLLSGGERLPPDLADQLLSRSSELWNLYGPTETTIWSTATRIEPAASGLPDVHIGEPIRETRCLIVDDADRALPVGVKGELIIGGAGVSSGYWQRAELNEARFYERDGMRYFRTGDQARIRPDGMLDCFGRNDDQIKLRGFRIELGEIDATLMRHPAVSGACAVVQAAGTSDERLVAYVVCPTEETDESLLTFAGNELPGYMVPTLLQRVDVLPLTPNLKVDRAALAARSVAVRPVGEQPVGELEQALAAQWCDLLGLANVGRHEAFFACGGDSLRLARLHRRLALALAHADLPPFADFIDAQTIAAQAALLEPGAGAAPLPLLDRAEQRDSFPATPFQSRLWMLEKFEDARGAHNVFGAFEVTGTDDEELLEARLGTALELLAERHEILRTLFAFAEDGIEQHVLASASVDLESLVIQEADLDEALARLGSRHFSLSEAPPWCVRIFSLPARKVIAICLHHTLVDGLSLTPLLRDLDVYLRADTISSTPVQFGDFARWRAALPDARREQATTYWREQLSGTLPVLNLPLFRPRPQLQDFSGAVLEHELPAELTAGLAATAASLGVSLNALLLTAYSMLLLRYAPEPELMIGLAATDRMLVDAAYAVGPYVNVLPLRIEQQDTVLGLVTKVREVLTGALANALLPFEEMIELLEVPRDLSRTPIYQTLYSFTDEEPAAPAAQAVEPALDLRPLPVPSRTARTDLSCFITRREGRLLVQLEYATALFEPWLAAQMLEHLERLCRGLCDRSSHAEPPGAIELTTPNERRALVAAGQASAQPTLTDDVDSLIDWQAFADRMAVQDDQASWTYEELYQAADRVAHGLAAAGIQPGACVAVSVSRSVALTAVLLGVWRAGCYYLPLDAELPPKRQAFMLEDSGCGVLVTDDPSGAADGVRTLALATLLATDDSRDLPDTAAGDHPMAYLIYTSGSTGTPKGVLVGQHQVANFLYAMQTAPGFSSEDRLLACTTLSFDIAVLELFLPLVCGGTLHMGSPALSADPKVLAALLEERAITVFQATPSAWRGLLQTSWQAPERLRAFVGGEAMSEDLLSELQARCAAVWNLYGPTETTIWSMAADLTGHSGSPVLGGPIRNTRIYLVDERDRPVPAGLQGELWIGGDGVAEGYWQREALTGERFVTDPFVDGGRLFRTGDLARRSASGEIIFLGRADQQVKLRGFRIELEEIAQLIREQPGVTDACALVRAVGQGDDRLVAYVECDDPEAFNRPGLMRELRRALPGYMIPQHTMLLERLPKTPNGKLDRNALPSPEPAVVRYEAPSTDTERSLAALWAETLKLEKISRQDRFFDIGGHSLSAIQNTMEIERRFGVALSPNLLVMENLAGVAAALDQQTGAERHEPMPGAEPTASNPTAADPSGDRPSVFARLRASLRRGSGG